MSVLTKEKIMMDYIAEGMEIHYSGKIKELEAKLEEVEALRKKDCEQYMSVITKLSIAIEALERIDRDCPVNPRLFTKEALEKIKG